MRDRLEETCFPLSATLCAAPRSILPPLRGQTSTGRALGEPFVNRLISALLHHSCLACCSCSSLRAPLCLEEAQRRPSTYTQLSEVCFITDTDPAPLGPWRSIGRHVYALRAGPFPAGTCTVPIYPVAGADCRLPIACPKRGPSVAMRMCAMLPGRPFVCPKRFESSRSASPSNRTLVVAVGIAIAVFRALNCVLRTACLFEVLSRYVPLNSLSFGRVPVSYTCGVSR